MAHEHELFDSDAHFIIDPETMQISCDSEVKALRCGDHNSEKYTFEMPRYIEGHDMSLCNVVQVHYDNVKYDKTTRETIIKKGFDEVKDFGFRAGSEETLVWIWEVKGDATQQDGNLNFCMRFACLEGSEIEYQKFSETYESIPVGASIFNTEEVAKVNTDALKKTIETALAEAKQSGQFDGYTPQKGIDYYTEADKAEMISDVLAQMPTWTGGSY